MTRLLPPTVFRAYDELKPVLLDWRLFHEDQSLHHVPHSSFNTRREKMISLSPCMDMLVASIPYRSVQPHCSVNHRLLYRCQPLRWRPVSRTDMPDLNNWCQTSTCDSYSASPYNQNMTGTSLNTLWPQCISSHLNTPTNLEGNRRSDSRSNACG